MRYIDFDGVILDTHDELFKEWYKDMKNKYASEEDKIKYVSESDWTYILNNSNVINESIYILNHMNRRESAILTKIHSLTNEGTAKVKFLRRMGVRQDIILVPYNLKKCEVVVPYNNELIDDSLRNLREWEEYGGIPLFFDKDNTNIDPWKEENTRGFQRVLRINEKVKK